MIKFRSLWALSTVALALVWGSCSSVTPTSELGRKAAAESLAGTWRFSLDANDVGVNERWFDRSLGDKIVLPGVLQSQGYGNEITPDTPWVTTLGDAWWKLQPESLRAKFSQPGKVEVPFLSQPPRHYLGAAWYQRDVEIPASSPERRYVLFLERPHWETTVWVDGTVYPANNSLVAPHVTELGVLAPGKHRLTIRVDNRQIVRDPVNDGHGLDGHSVSDALGATWNGIVGRIELQATPTVWIEDVQVFPNVRKKSALVRVTLGNATGTTGSGTLTAQPGAGQSISAPPVSTAPTKAVTWDKNGGTAELEVSLGENAVEWDEFHPVMQNIVVRLSASAVSDAKEVTFGLREVSWRDKDLLLNGRVINLRTNHSGGDFPLTGYPATDVESWRKIFRVCQEFGLNGIRFHSWCPPEAAFTAADGLGFYLQPECGLWAPFTPDNPYTKYLEEETPRLLKAYGNHPSFILLSPSNEPSGRYTQVTPKWAANWYEKDPRRLYSAGTGWNVAEQVTGGAQFAVLVRFGLGELRNTKGWFGDDYRKALEGYFDPRAKVQVDVHIPVLAHEVGQWCAYPDFDVIKEFTGYMRPSNYHIFQYIAEQTGLAEINHELAWSSGRFQLACYKEEIEANLRTPSLAGYQLLDLHDYLGQGTALIGVLDAFWKPKSYVTAAEFRRFNSATVPLARLTKRTFTSDETLTADVELYHFGVQPLTATKSQWKIVDAAGQIVVAGDFAVRDVPIGKNIPLGKISADLSKLPAPAAYKLVVGLTGTKAENDWNFWLYPAQIDASTPADILVTSNWTEAEAKLATGGKVLFVPTTKELDANRSPTMRRTPVFWNIQMTVRPPRNPTPQFDAMLGLLCDVKHPALAKFPTDRNCDWQWAPLIDGVRSVNLTDAPRELKPIVATIDDWNRAWRLGVVFECATGKGGKLMVSTIPFDKSDITVGAKQLRRSLLDYMASAAFQPKTRLALAEVRQLWSTGPVSNTPRARVFDPDLDDGSGRPATPPPAKQ